MARSTEGLTTDDAGDEPQLAMDYYEDVIARPKI